MVESTLSGIKPDKSRFPQIVATIIRSYIKDGLYLAALKQVQMDEVMFDNFYGEHKGKSFYETLKNFSLSGPTIYCIWTGDDAVERVRSLNGATDPVRAELGTLRYIYGNREPGKMHENAVHGSATYEAAVREIKIIFG